MSNVHVLIALEGESWKVLLARAKKKRGEVLIILSGCEQELSHSTKESQKFADACEKIGKRLQVALRDRVLASRLRSHGLTVIDRPKSLKKLLHGHAQIDEAVHAFSPHVWRQQLRSHLQSIGLLSLPKLRVWILITVSCLVFFFILFKLLPSGEIRVTPREDTISQTSNIFLVLSGATVELPPRVRTMELKPFIADVHRSRTFDQISKEFIGTSSEVEMTIINESDEEYKLRKTSRLMNQAGMIFRIQEDVFVKPGEETVVPALADDIDIYDEVIGKRGNVPEGLKWEFPGLDEAERKLVYAENRVPAVGGETLYRTVVHEGDLELARIHLEEELRGLANQQVDEQFILFNSQHTDQDVTRLYYDELTTLTYTGFVLPTQFIGERMSSVPVEGGILYTAYGYDRQYILSLLTQELKGHVEEGKKLLPDSVKLERLVTHVIDYADDLSWIKLTVDLSGTQQAILDPFTSHGAKFAKKVRDLTLGKSKEEAERIIRNLPEVEKVEVSIWPPWSSVLPNIPSHIVVAVGDE